MIKDRPVSNACRLWDVANGSVPISMLGKKFRCFSENGFFFSVWSGHCRKYKGFSLTEYSFSFYRQQAVPSRKFQGINFDDSNVRSVLCFVFHCFCDGLWCFFVLREDYIFMSTPVYICPRERGAFEKILLEAREYGIVLVFFVHSPTLPFFACCDLWQKQDHLMIL